MFPPDGVARLLWTLAPGAQVGESQKPLCLLGLTVNVLEFNVQDRQNDEQPVPSLGHPHLVFQTKANTSL